MRSLHIVILSRISKFGLDQDAKLIEQVLREITIKHRNYTIATIDHIDPLQFVGGRLPRQVDVQIHLEQPCRAAVPWAQTNILVINPEWWMTASWEWALRPISEGGMNQFIFKCEAAKAVFPSVTDRATVLPWRAPPILHSTPPTVKQAICLLGGSVNKLEAAKQWIPWWKPTDPPLTIYGSAEVIKELPSPSPNVIYTPGYLSPEEKLRIQQSAMYHVVASAAEGFGYTMAEAAKMGAIPIWTALPVYEAYYSSALGTVGKIAVTPKPASTKKDSGYTMTEAAFRTAMDSIHIENPTIITTALQTLSQTYTREFRQGWRRILTVPTTVTPTLPPSPPRPLPKVAVLTLTHNRKKWWQNMAENILRSTYPNEQIVWVIVDDSRSEERVDRHVQQFQEAHPKLHLIYRSLSRKTSIGEKRNIAVEAAIPFGTTIFMNMDDDDYYPPSSILARVSWMQRGTRLWGAVYCATLPLYDARKYTSAMNVPPLTLKPEERVSEASLTFTKTFWEGKKFPSISVAEGESFLEERIHETMEIPPEGVIVAIQHSANATSRRVPEEQEPNGCHYGFTDEYFSYLSTIA